MNAEKLMAKKEKAIQKRPASSFIQKKTDTVVAEKQQIKTVKKAKIKSQNTLMEEAALS